MREMTRLIQLQRTFDAITAATGQVEASLGEAIRTLGS
jgi:flagellar basal body rod protein FlgG